MAQYFLIACIAAVVGHYSWESAQRVTEAGGAEGLKAAIDIKGMVVGMWRDYYRWVLGAFAGLSAARLLVVLAFHRAKQGVD